MNTLIAVAIAPLGQGEELAPLVAQVVEVIRASGLPYRTTSMFTEIEGPWDEAMAVVKEASFVLVDQGYRTEVILKADIRPGHSQMLTEKVAKIDAILGGPDHA